MAAALRLLYEDERLIVVDKPAGLLSVGRDPESEVPSLEARLRSEGRQVIAVHRLDREVSGAIAFALDRATRDRFEELFRAGAVAKTYWALAQGKLEPPSGQLHYPILEEGAQARVSARGARARTGYVRLKALALPASIAGPRAHNAAHTWVSELQIDLLTGRHNQIRVHFAHHGHALVGERKYARGADFPLRHKRVALHAWALGFPHPWTADPLELESPLPEDLVELLGRAQGEGGKQRR